MAAVETRVKERNARAAVRASMATDPDPADALRLLYTDGSTDDLPAEAGRGAPGSPSPRPSAGPDGAIAYQDALRDAMIEEMLRDRARHHSTARTSPTTAAPSS